MTSHGLCLTKVFSSILCSVGLLTQIPRVQASYFGEGEMWSIVYTLGLCGAAWIGLSTICFWILNKIFPKAVAETKDASEKSEEVMPVRISNETNTENMNISLFGVITCSLCLIALMAMSHYGADAIEQMFVQKWNLRWIGSRAFLFGSLCALWIGGMGLHMMHESYKQGRSEVPGENN